MLIRQYYDIHHVLKINQLIFQNMQMRINRKPPA